MRYFWVTHDPTCVDFWFPGRLTNPDGTVIDPRQFIHSTPYDGPRLSLSTAQPGPVLPITLGPFELPVVKRHVGETLAARAPDSLQCVPVDAVEDVAILNVLSSVDCIDKTRTVGDTWGEGDGRPDKIGLYRTIVHLAIDPERTGGALALRVAGWPYPLILSEILIASLSQSELAGVSPIQVA